jgi:hypothetical protein
VGLSLKNMGSAQLDNLAFEETAEPPARSQAGPQEVRDASRDLKSEVAERLRAHRERRARPANDPQPDRPQPRTRNNPIAAAVAERFAQTPSYRAILAEQARLATEQAARDAERAAAEAEVAARNAHAIAEAQQQLMVELELWEKPQHFTPATAEIITAQTAPPAPQARAERRPSTTKAASSLPVKEVAGEGLTVRLYEDLGPARQAVTSNRSQLTVADLDEVEALDEEIAFRHSPVFEAFEPATPLPANLLEFPRQLVAARKARPRVAEGPLIDEAPRNPQLRIFEVEAEQISTAPASTSVTPEWASIRLDAQESVQPTAEANPELHALPAYPVAIQSAPFGLRIMAAGVDLGLVGGAFIAFVAVAAHVAHGVPTGIPAAIGAAAVLAIFYLLFQVLFFTLSDQTPGMRYARIGLCTFSDENPTRAAMRRRILAQGMAVLPLGLGLLWALLDDDGLGWHDRLSRMYQRAY